MAEYTIFGSDVPTGGSFGDGGAWVVATAFKVSDVAGWRALGVRFYIGGWTLPAGTYTGYLMDSSTDGTTPNRILETEAFITPAQSQWNEVEFDTPHELTLGKRYWVAVHFPTGVFLSNVGGLSTPHVADDTEFLATDNSAGNGFFIGPGASPGAFPTSASGVASFYGIDVLVDDGLGAGVTASDTGSATDEITVVRGGFPAALTATAEAEDPLEASDTAEVELAIGGNTGQRVIRRNFYEGFTNYGSAARLHEVQGPTLGDDLDGGSEVGFQFTLTWDVRLVGTRFYKPPDLAGSVPLSVWRRTGASLLHQQTLELVADGGGWMEVLFAVPLEVGPDDGELIISYFQVNGKQARSDTIWYAQDRSVPPFYVKNYLQLATGEIGGSAVRYGSAGFPVNRSHSNWYIDPIIEFDDNTPAFTGDTDLYLEQWTNGGFSNPFPVGVFFADPPDLQGYMDIGVNLLMATGYEMGGHGQNKIDAIVDSGIDVIANIGAFDLMAVRAQAEDPAFAERLKGYFIIDEPDMGQSPYYSPAECLTWLQDVRQRDSTRPMWLNLGYTAVWNQGYYYAPYGATLTEFNESLREYAAIPDFLSCDMYCTTPSGQMGVYGIWCYAEQVKRMVHLCEGRLPIFGYVESTSADLNRPTPSEVYKATWSCLIAGARGIVYFDHRFASGTVTQDFAAMLNSPEMSAAITDLSALLQDLGPALHAAEAGLVTSVESSNKDVGPVGGTFGVPIHCTSRFTGETYVFAQAIRPGTTTGTFTAPTLANMALEVIGEDREIEINGDGVWQDDFSEDYEVHLYRVTDA